MFPFSSAIISCWIVFWLYWFVSAFGAKKNSRSNVDHFIGIRLSLFVIAFISFRVFNVQNSLTLNHVAINNELVRAVGFIIFLLGLLLAIWARLYLGRNWGMPMTLKQSPELVTTGPYHYIRHPIYSGIILAVVGSVIASGIYWLILLVISGSYFIYSAFVEEGFMIKQFPKVYPAYKSKTKMLIPFIF